MATIDWSTKLAQYLNLAPESTATRGSLLSALGNAVQSEVERQIGRTLTETEFVEEYDGDGKSHLILRNDPITKLTDVSVNGAPLDLSNVAFRQQHILLTDGTVFPWGTNNVVVSYSAGFRVPPPDLVHACVEWAGMLFKDRDRLGLTSTSAGGQNVSYTRDVPPFVKLACSKWTRWGLPPC